MPAITGPRTMDRLQDLLGVAAVQLEDATLDRINDARATEGRT
jgi:aryl-alcohol dehydrogenase-like predicted oxidoreductase